MPIITLLVFINCFNTHLMLLKYEYLRGYIIDMPVIVLVSATGNITMSESATIFISCCSKIRDDNMSCISCNSNMTLS